MGAVRCRGGELVPDHFFGRSGLVGVGAACSPRTPVEDPGAGTVRPPPSEAPQPDPSSSASGDPRVRGRLRRAGVPPVRAHKAV